MSDNQKYAEMRAAGASPVQVCQAAQDDGLALIVQTRLVRELFGLSLVDAKAAMIMAHGGKTLEEHQQTLISGLEEVLSELEQETDGSHDIEFTSLLSNKAGNYVARLPWRRYPGLLLDETSIVEALQLVQHVMSVLRADGADFGEIESILDMLTRCRTLLASDWSARLRQASEPPAGQAICVRPAQLARPHGRGAVFVVLHLDTLASLEGEVRCALNEVSSPSAREALATLLSIVETWYSRLRDETP